MKARSPFALGFLVLLCAAATSSFAGEGKTYKIDMQDRWKAGDVVTKTSKDVESNHVTVKGPDGAVVQEKNTTTTITAELIEKAVEVDEKDRISKGLLYVVRCEIDAEGAKDESLSGAQFEFSGVGKLRSWKLLTPGKELTDPAKEWLDKEYGNKKSNADETMAKALEPKKEIEVGESWVPDVAEITKGLGDQFKVDMEKSTAKATLNGVEGSMGDFTFDISLQTLSVSSPAGEMKWKDGGMMTMKMAMKHSLEANDPTMVGKLTFGMKGNAEVQGMTVALDVSGTKDGETKKGGEIPALPAEGAGK